MDNWNFLIPSGRLFIDFAIIGGLFLFSMAIRARVKILQDYLVPVNLVAGALGLAIGNGGLGLVNLDPDRMGVYVYHLLALTFIAVSLGAGERKVAKTSLITGFVLVMTYIAQAVLGIGLSFLIKYLFVPDLFLGFGMLLTLGFGMGPGIAFSISRNWEQYGFTDGGVAGLTMATIGFLWAYIGGVIIMRRGIRGNESSHFNDGLTISPALRSGYVEPEDQESAGKQTTPIEVVEALTIHFGVIGFVYLLTVWVCMGLEHVLSAIGAEKEISTLWSFHFLIGSMVAIAFRKAMNILNFSKWLDTGLLHRTSNLFVDFMIAASLAAISLQVAYRYWIPIVVISTAGGFLTWWILRKLVYGLFQHHKFERFLAFFGNSTGTIQSGLVLLRVVDPLYKTGSADDLVYGSSVALGLGFPLLILINLPVHQFNNSDFGYVVVTGLLILYFAVLGTMAYLRLRSNGE